MKLVSILATNRAEAANGTAKLFAHETSTPIQWWTDFEGLGPQSAGTDVQLDSNGKAEVYVQQLADVRIYNSDGVELDNLVLGEDGSAVIVKSPAFTGTNHETGIEAANEEVTITELFDRWKETNGGTDWKILLDGVETPISGAIGSLIGLVYNVKDPEYGAVGDGVADDTTAIDAAIAAATPVGDTPGGIVFFPKGTYLCASQLVIKAGVWLVGVGRGASVLRSDETTKDSFLWNSNSGSEVIAGLRFEQLSASSYDILFSSSSELSLIHI